MSSSPIAASIPEVPSLPPPSGCLRIVIKFGSGVLTEQLSPTIDGAQVWKLMREVAQLREKGHQVIVVTSGAVAAGLKVMGCSTRPTDVSQLQACAAVGQGKLMHLYEQVLREYGLHVGQMLVTHEDFAIPARRSHIRNTLAQLLANPAVVPVFNENDSVAIEEIRFGDNDALSAQIATLAQADSLILLTTVDGLQPPDGGDILQEVRDIKTVLGFARDDKGAFSVGGMTTKLQAVMSAVDSGVQTVIANGRHPERIGELVAGRGIGTRFYPL